MHCDAHEQNTKDIATLAAAYKGMSVNVEAMRKELATTTKDTTAMKSSQATMKWVGGVLGVVFTAVVPLVFAMFSNTLGEVKTGIAKINENVTKSSENMVEMRTEIKHMHENISELEAKRKDQK